MWKTFIVTYETPERTEQITIRATSHKTALRLFNDKLQAEGKLGIVKDYNLQETEDRQLSLF